MGMTLTVTREQARDIINALDSARITARAESTRRFRAEVLARHAADADRLDETFRAILTQLGEQLGGE